MFDFETIKGKIFDHRFKVFIIDYFENSNYNDHILGDMPDVEKWEKKKLSLSKYDLKKIPTMLHAYYKFPILSKEQEQHLFRKMHYCRHKSVQHGKAFEITKDESEKESCVSFYKKQIEIRDMIVACNIRLTTTVIKQRKSIYGKDLPSLISDGFLNLIKASEAFDYRKNIKFSTYCTWVLLNNSVREQTPNLKFQEFFSEYQDENEENREDEKYKNAILKKESNESALGDWDKIKKKFSLSMSKEIQVIKRCFGIDCDKEDIETIAQDMGISRERVRQLRKKGIKEIKKSFDEGLIDLVGF